jgi:hypothetical protein
LKTTGGCIVEIVVGAPGNNPFRGMVHFDRAVYFPRTIVGGSDRVQSYRNMRAHMLELENTPMVNRFHTLEQASERRLDRWGFQRFVSWLYEMLSDYGSSVLRPLLWFVLLLVLTTAIVYLTSGAETVDAQTFKGWQEALIGTGQHARIHRAIILTLQSTLNPLGIFGAKVLLVARTSWLAAWLSFHGLATAILVALFILAIRRRFKMQ